MIAFRYISAEDWPALAAGFSDLGFEQSLTYARAAADRIGADLKFIRLDDAEGRAVAAACMRVKAVPGLGRGIAWIASGPLVRPVAGAAPEAARMEQILAALREQIVIREGHVLRLRLPGLSFGEATLMDEAAQAAGFHKTDRAPSYQSVAIDLSLGEEARMTALHGKWRNALRKALKADLRLDKGKSPELQARFMALFNVIQAAKGFAPDITPQFHFALDGPDYDWRILIATKDGQDLAGIVVGQSGATAVYLFGATDNPGRRLNAGYFLTWSGLADAEQRGLLWYDMGGIDAEANPAVTEFKTRMNGREILAPGPYEACGSGPVPRLVLMLEALRSRLKARR